MGRSFMSVRMGINDLTGRWTRAAHDLPVPDQTSAHDMVCRAKTHASKAFPAFDDPVEAALFSALVELFRERDTGDDYGHH
jgi:hypothetical protein